MVREDVSQLDNDPAGGIAYYLIRSRDRLNPFHMIPAFNPAAEELFASDERIGDVPMSTIRKNWAEQTVMVGVYNGTDELSCAVPDEELSADAAAAMKGELTRVTFTVVSPVDVDVRFTNGSTSVTDRVDGNTATRIVRNMAIREVPVTVGQALTSSITLDSEAVALYGKLKGASAVTIKVQDSQHNLRSDGQRGQIGYACLVAAAGLVNRDQRRVASALLIPGVVYDNTTAMLLR